jgi:hypothetical protein
MISQICMTGTAYPAPASGPCERLIYRTLYRNYNETYEEKNDGLLLHSMR